MVEGLYLIVSFIFFFQAEDGIRDKLVTGVQTCALPIYLDRMKIAGGVAAIAVSAVLATALAACGGSDSKVSVDNLQKAPDKMIAADTNPSPLRSDDNAALKNGGDSATETTGAGWKPLQL